MPFSLRVLPESSLAVTVTLALSFLRFSALLTTVSAFLGSRRRSLTVNPGTTYADAVLNL